MAVDAWVFDLQVDLADIDIRTVVETAVPSVVRLARTLLGRSQKGKREMGKVYFFIAIPRLAPERFRTAFALSQELLEPTASALKIGCPFSLPTLPFSYSVLPWAEHSSDYLLFYR